MASSMQFYILLSSMKTLRSAYLALLSFLKRIFIPYWQRENCCCVSMMVPETLRIFGLRVSIPVFRESYMELNSMLTMLEEPAISPNEKLWMEQLLTERMPLYGRTGGPLSTEP